MLKSLNLDEALLKDAQKITGLPTEATVEEALRRMVTSHRQRQALDALDGIGWDGPHHSRPNFETLAAEFRALTAEREHTASDVLMREGRDER